MDLETPGAQAPHTHPPCPLTAEIQFRRPSLVLPMADNAATQLLGIAQNQSQPALIRPAGVKHRARNPWAPLPRCRLQIRGQATEHYQTNKVTNTGEWRQSFCNTIVF